MRIRPFYISLLIACVLSIATIGILINLKTIGTREITIVVLFIFLGSLLLTYLLLDFLVFRYLKQLVSMLERQSKSVLNPGQKAVRLPRLVKQTEKIFEEKNKSIEELKKLAAFRKEFIADVSHELKTPIFAAQGFVHTLLDGAIKDRAVRNKFLRKAARSLDGLDVLVQDLVTLSQMEIGEVRMHKEYFDLVQLCTEVLEQFEAKSDKKEVRLGLKKSGNEEIFVFADPNRIFQVLSNLVSNSINYTDEGGSVEISLIPGNKFVEVKVTDTGIGIPAEDISRIFQRFYRVDKSRSRKQGGTGLGLAIVKHIIELHKSEIKVESEPGKGSTFSFRLSTEKASSPEEQITT